MDAKRKFLRFIHARNSIQAGVSTRNAIAPVYKSGASLEEKKEFRSFIVEFLVSLWVEKEVLTKEEMLFQIKELSGICDQNFKDTLDGPFRLGISQKIVNLFAKFLWTSGELQSPPPLIPYDGIVKSHLSAPELEAWTTLSSEDDYERILHRIEEVSGNLPPAEWELAIWQNSVQG